MSDWCTRRRRVQQRCRIKSCRCTNHSGAIRLECGFEEDTNVSTNLPSGNPRTFREIALPYNREPENARQGMRILDVGSLKFFRAGPFRLTQSQHANSSF